MRTYQRRYLSVQAVQWSGKNYQEVIDLIASRPTNSMNAEDRVVRRAGQTIMVLSDLVPLGWAKWTNVEVGHWIVLEATADMVHLLVYNDDTFHKLFVESTDPWFKT